MIGGPPGAPLAWALSTGPVAGTDGVAPVARTCDALSLPPAQMRSKKATKRGRRSCSAGEPDIQTTHNRTTRLCETELDANMSRAATDSEEHKQTATRSHSSDSDPALLSAWHAHAEARQKKIAAAMAMRQQNNAPAAATAAPVVSRRPAIEPAAQDGQRTQLEREQVAAAARRAALEAQLAKHHAYLDSLSGGSTVAAAPPSISAAASRAPKADFTAAPSASGLLQLGSSTLLVSPPPTNSYATAYGLPPPAKDRSSTRLEQPQPQQHVPPPAAAVSRGHSTSDSFDAAAMEVDAAERYLAGVAAASNGDDDSTHNLSSSSPPTNHPSSSPHSNASAALSPAGPGTPTPRSTNSFGYDEFALSENVFVLSEKIRSGSGAPSVGHSRNASGSNSARKSGPGSLYARATPTRSIPASPNRTSFNVSPQPGAREIKPSADSASASPGRSAYSTPSEVSPLQESRNLSLNTSNVSKFYLPHERANSGGGGSGDQANGNSNEDDWKEVDKAGADLFALAGVGMIPTEMREMSPPREHKQKQQQSQPSQSQPRPQPIEQQPQRHQLDRSDTRPRAGRPPTRSAPSAAAPQIDPTAPSTLNPFGDRGQVDRDASPQHRLHGSPTASSLLRVKNAQQRAAQHRAYLDYEDQIKPKVLSPEQLKRLHERSRSRSLSPPKQHPSATLTTEELQDPALSPLTNQALAEHVRADQYRPQNAGASISRPTASSALRTRLTTEPPPPTKQHTRAKSRPRSAAVVPVISVMPVASAPARPAANEDRSHGTRPSHLPPRPQTAAVRPPPAMPFSDMYAAVEAEEQARLERLRDRDRHTDETTESNTATEEWNTELDDQDLDEAATTTQEAVANSRLTAPARSQPAAPALRAGPKRAPADASALDAESLMESQLLRLDSALELQKLRDEIHRLRNDSGHGALFADYESTIAALQKQNESLRTKLARVECAPEMLRWVRSPTKRRGGDGQDDDDDPVSLPGAPASSVAKYRVLEASYRRAHEELAALHTAHNALRKKERLFTFQTKQLHLLETRLTESAAAANRKEKDLAVLRTQLQSANVVNTELKTLVTDLAAKQSQCEDRLRRSVEQSLALKATVESLQQSLFDAKAATILGKLKVSPSSASLRRSTGRFEGLDDLAELESIFKESRRPDAPPALVAAVSKKGLETLVRLRGRVEVQAREHEATKGNEKALLMTIMKMQEARKQ